jgi:flagellar hook-basal body protein
MGIYVALSSAVTGLRAQAHALESISGNIANSQTVGYKRTETDFLDLVSDAPLKRQVPGAVLAQSRGTNNVQGDIETVSNETYIALNGNGFFVVEPKVGQSDGNTVFAGTNFFTRRGDFEIDNEGMLVNGAGYYLKGLPIDLGTGNLSGSVPEVIKLPNAFLPARQTGQINYQANLPELPQTSGYQPAISNSELLKPWTYSNPSPPPVYPAVTGLDLPNPVHSSIPARAVGAVRYEGNEAASSIVNDGDMLSVEIGNDRHNLWFDTDGGPSSAIRFVGGIDGADTSSMRVLLRSGDIGALHGAGDLMIGGTPIPFAAPYNPTIGGLLEALGDTLPPEVAFGYNYIDGRLNFAYNTSGTWQPTPTASGGSVATYDSSYEGYTSGSAVTILHVDRGDLAGLNRTGRLEIGGITVPFAAPAFAASSAGLISAIEAALPAESVNYDEATGTLTITYAPGARSADTSAYGVSTMVAASTTSIEGMLAAIQTELRALSGDSALWVKLKNGQVTVSLGPENEGTLALSSSRTGLITGDVLGLSGSHSHVPGTAMTAENTYADLVVNNADTLVINIGETRRSYIFDTDGRAAPGPGQVVIAATGSLAAMLAAIQADLRANGGNGAASATVSYGSEGVRVAFPGNYYYDAAISGSAAATLGVAGTYTATAGQVRTIQASDSGRFLSESISGGAVTVYASNGAPANVQMRWAKLDSVDASGQDIWNLYYMANSSAVGSQTMWARVGEHFQFAADGSLDAPTGGATKLTELTIDGVAVGDIELRYGTDGLSQFANINGTANVSTLNQNGYGAGDFISVAINDNGRVVASYSNGQRMDVAQVITAQFSASNQLKRLDGGTFVSTSESGEPILDLEGNGVMGGSVEASNTDISEEFTKLIVTQQAYAAGTRMVSTANEMLQEALNMIR